MSHMITLPRDSSIRNLGEKDMQLPFNCAHPTDNSDSIRKATIALQQRLTSGLSTVVLECGQLQGMVDELSYDLPRAGLIVSAHTIIGIITIRITLHLHMKSGFFHLGHPKQTNPLF